MLGALRQNLGFATAPLQQNNQNPSRELQLCLEHLMLGALNENLGFPDHFAMKQPESFENNYRYACKAERLKPWIKIRDSQAPLQQNNQHPSRSK